MNENKIVNHLSDETLAAIGAAPNKPIGTSNQQKDQLNNVDYRNVIFYDSNLPRPISSVTQLSLRQLCEIITRNLKSVLYEYYGCTFVVGQNGLLEFKLIFMPKAGDPEKGKFKNIVLPNKENLNNLQAFIEAGVRKTNRRIMDLNIQTKDTLLPHMVKPNNGPFNWNDCLEERETNMMGSYYMSSQKASILIVKNVNVESLIDSIWTPDDVQEANYNESYNNFIESRGWIELVNTGKKDQNDNPIMEKRVKFPNGWNANRVLREMPRIKSFKCKLVFRGHRWDDGYNIYFNPQVMNNGVPAIDYDRYYVNIEMIDMMAAKRTFPAQSINQSGFMSTVW